MKKKSRNEKKIQLLHSAKNFYYFFLIVVNVLFWSKKRKAKKKKTGPKKDVNALEIKPKYLFVYNNNYGKQMRTLLFGSKTSPQI